MNSIDIHELPVNLNKHAFISDIIVNNNLDVEFIYKSDFKNAKILRDFIEVICIILWLSDKNTVRFILIIDELNNNAIEYWSDKCWYNKLRIKVKNSWDSFDIVMEVEDNWKWEKHKTALEMETLRAHQLRLWYLEHNSIRWRGLFMIIVKSVDRLYFKDSKNWWLIVWIKKNIII